MGKTNNHNLAVADAELLLNYRRMKDIRRCNNFHTIRTEDVAQHSYYVTLLSLFICDEYNENTPDGIHLRSDIVMRKALLHDTDECFTSDIPYNIKHADEQTQEVIENALTKRINSAYEGTSVILQDYKMTAATCKEKDGGYVVAVADMLELAIYCYEEVTMGNHWMMSLLDKAVKLTYDIINSYDERSSLVGFSTKIPTIMYILTVLQTAATSGKFVEPLTFLDIN